MPNGQPVEVVRIGGVRAVERTIDLTPDRSAAPIDIAAGVGGVQGITIRNPFQFLNALDLAVAFDDPETSSWVPLGGVVRLRLPVPAQKVYLRHGPRPGEQLRVLLSGAGALEVDTTQSTEVTGAVRVTDPLPAGSNLIGQVDVTDEPARQLGQVSVAGGVDVSDRAGRQLGQVTLPDATGAFFAASGTVKAAPGRVLALAVIGTATAGYVQLRDGGSSGAVRWRMETEAVAGATAAITFPRPLRFDTSIYIEVSSAAASVQWE